MERGAYRSDVRRILEAVVGSMGQGSDKPTIDADMDSTDSVRDIAATVRRILNRELEINLQGNVSPAAAFQVDVADLLVPEMGHIVRGSYPGRNLVRDQAGYCGRLADAFRV